MIEILVIGLVVLLAFSLGICIHFGSELGSLRLEVREINQDLTYKLLKPQIEELCKLYGYEHFGQNGDYINFYSPNLITKYELLTEIESSLKKLKQVLELNCPQKCTKFEKGDLVVRITEDWRDCKVGKTYVVENQTENGVMVEGSKFRYSPGLFKLHPAMKSPLVKALK